MKKILLVLITAFLMAGILSGCSRQQDHDPEDKKLQIVTTIFPVYDWVMNVLGDNPGNAEVTMLLDTGADLHSYQPTAADMMKITSADIFVYVGGESDEWVEDVLKNSSNDKCIVMNLMDILGDRIREEEHVEGMEHDHEEEETEYDEHIWLSLRNAAVRVKRIEEALSKADSGNASVYQNNRSSYVQKLDDLDRQYRAAVSRASVKTLLFADRFPFRYLTEDYGLNYYAAFAGCSAESEASFETVTFLARKIDELNLKAVLTIEGTDHRIADTVIRTTVSGNQKILTLNSLQSITARDVAQGISYLTVMEENLKVLKEALQ